MMNQTSKFMTVQGAFEFPLGHRTICQCKLQNLEVICLAAISTKTHGMG